MRKLPPLGALRAFEAAARLLSFKAAADELGLTPTAISHQIRLLETHCEQALFRRRPRPLALTRAGARLFPVVREGLDRFAAALTALAAEPGPAEPLRVTTTKAFAHRWLVPRLALWRQAHPELEVEVTGTDAVLDLGGGEADVAIRYQRGPPAGVAAEELFRDRFWPIASPAVLTGAPVRGPADLARHTLIHCPWRSWDPSPPTWATWLAVARRLGMAAPHLGETPSLGFRDELAAVAAVIAGQGIALLSDVLVAPELASGALVKVLDLPLPGFGFYLVQGPGPRREAAVSAFLAWLRAVA